MRAILVVACMLAGSVPALARTIPADPLGSPMWDYRARALFGDDLVRFDPRVKVDFPGIAENQHVFPVAVDARGIEGVRRIVLFADLNPIPVAIDYRPGSAAPYIATRIKLDQRTPVRGAVQLANGEWLVSGGWVDAAGGGCSAPPVSRVKGDWADHLGEMQGAAWPLAAREGYSRLRLSIRHPMDTGLVENIGSYYIERISLTSQDGTPLGELAMQAAVAEDPSLTLMPRAAAGDVIAISGRDTGGRTYGAHITVAKLSPLPETMAR